MIETAQAGWFGPSSEQECIKEYEKKMTNDITTDAVKLGCHYWFVRANKSLGKCFIHNISRIKNEWTLQMFSIGCVQFDPSNKFVTVEQAKCADAYADTVRSESGFLEVLREKCNLPLKKQVKTKVKKKETATTTTSWVPE
jgi:hypothetical protein